MVWGDSVYFKSTDGHFGVWDLNLRRWNGWVVELVAEIGGCIIVDSTRHGKRIPDSLSKTVPIWCVVVNRAILKYRQSTTTTASTRDDDGDWDVRLHVPPGSVSESEKLQIEERLDEFVDKVLASQNCHIPYLSSILKKPLRPIWLTPDTRFFLSSSYPNANAEDVSFGESGNDDAMRATTTEAESTVGVELNNNEDQEEESEEELETIITDVNQQITSTEPTSKPSTSSSTRKKDTQFNLWGSSSDIKFHPIVLVSASESVPDG
ncbi:hypothetical protein HDU76_011117, partial [Blyttiomyces sp. JEL0837]